MKIKSKNPKAAERLQKVTDLNELNTIKKLLGGVNSFV